MLFFQATRLHSLFYSLLWITAALLIGVAMPAGAANENEEYVLKLNGRDAYVRVEDEDELRITGDLTLEALVYWDGSPGYQVIVSKPDTADQTGWAFGIRDGQPEFNGIRIYTEEEDLEFWTDPIREYIIKPFIPYTLEPHTWNHLAIIVENIPGYSGSFRIFHNGTSDVSWIAANGAFLQSENTPLLIGRKFESDPESSFSGYIDYVRIWNTAFSPDTIRDWYSQTDVTNHPHRQNLVAYWDFNDGEGSVVSDISGNGHTGQLMNGAEWAKKEEVFRIGALEAALSTARQSLIDHPEGVNIGEAPRSAREAMQSAIDAAQDMFENHEGLTQEAIDQATDVLLNAIEAFLATVVTPENVVHFEGGSGTEEDPYLIRTPEQLHQIRGNLSAYYRMVEDIDLAGWSWEPIGSEARPFTGGLDGNGKIIKNLTISVPDEDDVGLFGVISTNGADVYVRHLGLENVNILGRMNVGALAGQVISRLNGSIRISNSYVSDGTIEARVFSAGGLFGNYGYHPDYELYTHDVYVKDVLVSAASIVGGLVGHYFGGHLSSAYVIGTVQATNDPNFGRSAGGIYSGFSVDADKFKMYQLYWDVTCDGCILSDNLFGQEFTIEQFKERASFGDMWDFEETWLLYDGYDMLPVLQMFHPLTELDVSVERSSVKEAGYFFPDETAHIQVTVVHDGFAPFELTGTDAVTYVFNDVVDVSSEGVVTALRPGEAVIEVYVGAAVAVIELMVHQILPDPPRELNVPATVMQGGAKVLLTWQGPEHWGIGEGQKYVAAFFDGTEWGAEIETTESELAIRLLADWNTTDAKFRVRTETSRGKSVDIESASFAIDSVVPEIVFVSDGSSEWVDTASTIVEVNDNLSGVNEESLRYLWSHDPEQPGTDAAWEAFDPETALTLNVDGRWYLHILAKDNAGHIAYARSKVFLVDGTEPTAPDLDVEHDVAQWITTTPVCVRITPGDDGAGSGVKDTLYRTKLVPGNWSEWMSVDDEEVCVEANGVTNLEAKTIDAAGHESSVKEITIRIDIEIPGSPVIDLSTNDWSMFMVKVELFPGAATVSGIAALEWTTDPDEGQWTIYNGLPVWIDTDGETPIYARAVNGAGTRSAVSSAVVRIDSGNPTIEASIITLGDGKEYISGTWTNQDVQISATFENEFSDIIMQEVIINGASHPYEEPIVLTKEGKYTVEFLAINEAFGLTFTNEDPVYIFIDKSIPGSPHVTTSAADWTNLPVTVEIEHGMITGASGIAGTEYKIGKNGDWTMYEGPFSITEDGEHFIHARTRNLAGSTTAEEDWAVAVVRIAAKRPGITLDAFTADHRIYEPNTWTNQAVTVTADVYSNAGVPLYVQYAISSEDGWVDYIEAVTVNTPGISTVQFRVEDAAGNVETADLDIKIEYDAPAVTIKPNGNDKSELKVFATVVVSDELSGVDAESLHYLWSSGSIPPVFGPGWARFANGGTLELSNQDGEWYLHIYAKDVAGNEVYYTSDRFTLRTLSPPEFILTTKTADGEEYSPNSWTKQAVSIEVEVLTESSDPVTVQYSTDLGQTWVDYEGIIVIQTEGENTVLIQVEDEAGNAETADLVIRIDYDAPTVTLSPNGNAKSGQKVAATVVVSDELSGFDAESLLYVWSLDSAPAAFGKGWQKFANGDALELSNRNGEWFLHIYAKDVAGNEVYYTSDKFLLHIPSPPDGYMSPPSRNDDDQDSGVESSGETDTMIRFSDIAGHWAEQMIITGASQKLVRGYPDGTFKPNNPITRAEFTVMLVHALQLDGTGATFMFADQDQIGSWAKQAIELAVQAGIVTGYNDGSFRPEACITREEMAVMLARALGAEFYRNTQTAFVDDDDISHWAKGAVEAIRQLGIISGRGGNRFVPKESATRAEAVVMLLRLLENKDNT